MRHHDPRQDPRLWQRALVAQELSDLRKRPGAEPSGDDDVEMAMVSGGARQFPMETHGFFASEVDRIQWSLRDGTIGNHGKNQWKKRVVKFPS